MPLHVLSQRTPHVTFGATLAIALLVDPGDDANSKEKGENVV